MNKNLYRIVWNAARGQRMAVQETASSTGKGRTRSAAPAFLTIASSLALMSGAALAQIVADPQAAGAQRATVLNAANGVPQVNIQTPSAAGVSRNVYSRFDVTGQGAILNNSRTQVQSQIGGWVQGNPSLARGSAKVILNEVNSANPSQLRGAIEVAGQRAEVVVANPAGIMVDGAAFINTSRATLTTGAPILNNGSLDGFRVQTGAVTIGGAGLDARSTDYTAILARAVVVNAGIWANELTVATGANEIGANPSQPSAIGGTGAAPGFALDVSALGGMYAGKIVLIGTEAGLGVRNAGVVQANAGNLVLNQNGWLSNSGTLSASQDVQVQAGAAVHNSGTVYASANTTLVAGGDIANTGLIGAQGNTNLTSGGNIASATGSVLAAGLQADNRIAGNTANLTVAANQTASLNGQSIAAADTNITGQAVDVSGGQLSAQNLALLASTGDVNATGATLTAQGRLTASTSQTLRTDGAGVSANQLSLTAQNLSNVGGTIVQAGAADLSLSLSGQVDNAGGTIASNGALTLRAERLTNQSGQIASTQGDLNITNQGVLNNTQGRLQAAGKTTVSSQALTNAGGMVIGDSLSIQTNSQALSNQGGTIASTGAALDLRVGSLNNDGGIVQSAGHLDINAAGVLSNSQGRLQATGKTTVASQALTNAGGVVLGESLQIQTNGQTLNNQGGTIGSTGVASSIRPEGGNVDLRTGSLNNEAGLVQAGGRLDINALGALSNSQGRLQAAGKATVASQALTNAGGLVIGNSLQIQTNGQALNNQGGTIASTGVASVTQPEGGNVDLRTGAFNNDAGLVQAGGRLDINTAGQTLTNTHSAGTGGIFAQGAANVQTGQLVNNGGFLGAVGDLDIQSTRVDNVAGTISGAGAVKLNASALDNSNTNSNAAGIAGRDVTLVVNQVDNQNGRMQADNNVAVIGSGSVNNNLGLMAAGNKLSIEDTQATSGANNLGKTLAVTNAAGTLFAGRNLSLNAASLAGDGKAASQGDISVKLLGNYTKTDAAQWQADGRLSMQFSGDFANTGALQVMGDLEIAAANIHNAAAAQITGTNVNLKADATILNQGGVVGMQDLTLQAGQSIQNVGPAALLGAASSTGTLTLLAPVIENRDDTTATDTAPQTLIFGMGNVILAGGQDANGNFSRAQKILNQSAQIESGASMLLAADQVTNTRRALTVGNDFTQSGPTTTGRVVWTDANPNVIGGRYIEPPHEGRRNGDYRFTTYTQDSLRNGLLSISPEARILVSGDLSLDAQLLQNYWSKVSAVGNVLLGSATVDQDSWRGAPRLMERTISSGTYEYTTYRCNRLASYDACPNGERSSEVWGPQTQDTIVGGYDSSMTSYGTLRGNGVTLLNGANSAAGSNTAIVAPGIRNSVNSGAALSNTALPINSPRVGTQLNAASVLSNITLPSGSTGLYHLSPNPSSRYLIETNSAFTSRQNWLSSDWYISQLGMDPATTQKRLGDGFYEQRLVREQVLALTGRTQLSGYSNEMEQYMALLTAGVAVAKTFGLAPGVSLNAAQIATLTSDVVVLEERTVEGQRVLVPVLYLAHARDGDLLPTGPLVAADNIELYDSKDLVNRGTLRANNRLVLDGAALDSQGGNLQSGGLTQISTHGNVDLSNAQLKAGSLNLDAGGQLLLASTTNTVGYQLGGQAIGSGSQTLLERIASIDVQGDAAIRTGGDFTQNGARLAVGGNLTALVGGNWNLGTVETGDTKQATRTGRVSGQASSTEIYNTTSQVSVGGNTQVRVGGDINAVGAQLDLVGGGVIAAKGNINLTGAVDSLQVNSTSASSSRGRKSSDSLQSETQTVQGSSISANNNLALISGGDIQLRATDINLTQGNLALQAQGDILVGAQNQHSALATTHTGSHSTGLSKTRTAEAASSSSDTAIGSNLSATNISAMSGRDTVVQGSSLAADEQIDMTAGRDLTLTSAQNSSQAAQSYQKTSSGLSASTNGVSVGRSAASSQGSGAEVTQIGSSVSGGRITMDAGRDANITASAVLSDTDIALNAGRNINILAATNTAQSNSESSSSGWNMGLAAGHLGRNIGGSKTSANESGTGSTTTSSTSVLSANAGSLTLNAGVDAQYKGTGQGNITTQGADLLAKDNIALKANAVDLQAVQDSTASTYHMDNKSVVVGVRLTGAVGGVIQQGLDRANEGNTGNDRLDAARTLKAGYDLYKSADQIPNAVAELKGTGDGNAIGVSAYTQVSQSRQDSSSANSTARGTNLQASNIAITATEGDITTAGAKLQAKDISLNAAKNLNLGAATSTASTQSSAKGNSFGGGVTLGGGEQNGISFQANASKFNANAKGSETTYDNTQIVATNNLTIKSGADTNLKGAQLAGQKVSADVGGNLNIETLQDQSSYESKSSSAGFNISVCVPPICAGTMVTGSVNVSNTSIDHNYQSAQGQSGIAAGADGFDIKVKGNTDLQGGAITSTATAEKNSLTTASLTTSDIQNTQDTKAQSSGMSAGYGGGSMASAVVSNVAANVMGNAVGAVGLPKNGNESSVTQSVISAGNIQIIGMGNKTQDAQSAANVALLTSRDPQTANGALTNTLTLQQAAEIEQNRQRAQENLAAAQMVGNVLDNVIGDLAAKNKDTWGAEGSAQKTLLHGLSGVVQAALGNTSALSGFAAGVVNEQIVDQMAQYLINNGVLPVNSDGSENKDFTNLLKAGTTLAGAGVGALTGGGKAGNIVAGGSIAGTATVNNYISHSRFRDIKNTVDKENAKLTQQCEASGCTQEKLNAIDRQMGTLEGALTIQQKGTFSEQDVKQLAQAAIELAPLYGTGESLLQVLTGRSSISGEEANRFWAAIGVVPVAGGIVRKVGEPAVDAVTGVLKRVDDVSSGNAEAKNIAAHEAYKDELLAAMAKPAISDPSLAKLINPLYRPNATVGSGSTAAAIRQELATGEPVGGAFHSQKAEDSIRSLESWLSKNPTALPSDRAAAENVIKDMQNALGGR